MGALQSPYMTHYLVQVVPKKGITWQITVDTTSPLPVFFIPVQEVVMMFHVIACNKGTKDVNVPSPEVLMPAEWVMPFPRGDISVKSHFRQYLDLPCAFSL